MVAIHERALGETGGARARRGRLRALRRSGAVRVAAVALAALLVAEGAVWLLRPREERIEPADVPANRYFDQDQLERGSEFRNGQRLLFIGTIAVEAGLLLAVALGRPRIARRALEALGRRPVLGGLAAGAGLSVAVALTQLPLQLAMHERAVDVELSTQGLGAWLGDRGKAAAIAAGLAAVGAGLLIALQRRFPRRWWLPAGGGVAAFAVLVTWLGPVLLAPIFNDFERLPDGPARDDVLELGRRAGVDIGEVYEIDASRRSRSLNAFVDGIGPTKRVVLYDNLLQGVERPARRAVVAHELAHVEHGDIRRGILFVAIVAPLGMLFVREAGGRLAARAGASPGTPAALPSFALALTIAVLAIQVPGNQLSRQIEASADQRALELTGDPEGMIDLQRRLSIGNVGDPDPPGWSSFLFRTHPATVDRIGAAVAYERAEGGGATGRDARPEARGGS